MLVMLAAASVAACPAPPRLFSPEVIGAVGGGLAPAFTPDGREVLFTRADKGQFRIMSSRRTTSGWSAPEVASFSGTWVDLETAFSPDGRYVVFASNRPARPNGEAVTANYNGGPQIGGNLWRVGRKARGGWGEPERLPDAINRSTSTWAPSVARNGDLIFMATDAATGKFRLNLARASRSGYDAPTMLPFSDGQSNDVDPLVSPDGRTLVFSSDRGAPGPDGKAGTEVLHIAFRKAGGWTTPEPLRLCDGWDDHRFNEIEPRFSPDGRTLYFGSRRAPDGEATGGKPRTRIWSVPFTDRLWK